MKEAEFEEKTFEHYFVKALSKKGGANSFSPGQVLEEALGFDFAFQISWWIQFRYFRFLMRPYFMPMPGIGLDELNEGMAKLSRKIPKYRLNFFVQAKRPQLVEGHKGNEWKCWEQPYFRYSIKTSQQNTLQRLFNLAKNRAAVVYAAPAMYQMAELIECDNRGTILQETNVVSVDYLTQRTTDEKTGIITEQPHKKYSYVKAGSHGYAHSKPKEVNGANIEQILQQGEKDELLYFDQHIIDIAKFIEESVRADDGSERLLSLARQNLIGDRDAEESIGPKETFSYALATIIAFSRAFEVSYVAIPHTPPDRSQ
jgi:hypothetical protein